MWCPETKTRVAILEGHSGSVKSISPHPFSSDCLVSGGRDSKVLFWDVRAPSTSHSTTPGTSGALHRASSVRPCGEMTNAHMPANKSKSKSTAKSNRRTNLKGEQQHSVTAVLHLADGKLVATAGATDRVVKLWDVRKLLAPVAFASPHHIDADALLTPQ
eukprot:jgi/Mesen1/9400/ME000614S08656